MPVGTSGSVKATTQTALQEEIKAQIILSNTYHLYLRPGTAVLQQAGGLHRFMSWDKPILTDSGGFQIFSLANQRKLTEEGASFRSHIDGSKHLFTPEKVIDIQRKIGADIVMAFDECPPSDAPREQVSLAVERTARWLERCFEQWQKTKPLYGYEQVLFPIVQGGVLQDLRALSAKYATQFDAVGYAIGGLAVGETAQEMYQMIETTNTYLPLHKPRYLMGVGTPQNLLEAMDRGVDMFDCVMPTRNARNGMLFTRHGILNIRNQKWKSDFSPLDEQGNSPVDRQYSKAYLRHLFVSNEILAPLLATLHNLTFYRALMEEAAEHIREQDFSSWKEKAIKEVSRRL